MERKPWAGKENPRPQKGKSILRFSDEYVVLDIETTGLNPARDEIIEIGAIRVRSGETVAQFSSLVRPSRPIGSFISGLTGITNGMVQSAPSIDVALPELLAFVGGDVIVGHNINFDINFLYDNALRIMGTGLSNNFVDTVRISRLLFPEMPHHRLCDLEEKFHLHNESAHRALSDVLLTAECYQRMRAYVEANGIDLWALQRERWAKAREKQG